MREYLNLRSLDQWEHETDAISQANISTNNSERTTMLTITECVAASLDTMKQLSADTVPSLATPPKLAIGSVDFGDVHMHEVIKSISNLKHLYGISDEKGPYDHGGLFFHYLTFGMDKSNCELLPFRSNSRFQFTRRGAPADPRSEDTKKTSKAFNVQAS